MKNLFLILLVCIASQLKGMAQIVLYGNVYNEQKEPLPFVNISLYSQIDSAQNISNGITDINGDYVLSNIRPGKYKISVSSVGYETQQEVLTLRMPSGGNRVQKNFILKEDIVNLQGIIVKANRKSVLVDKSVYTFTNEQRKQARHSADLLEQVGDLTVDPITGSIQKINGGKITILINGLHASSNDLKSIQADKVKKVEYYIVPPARYMAAGTLVNIVTKQLDTGITGGTDISHAFTTGYFNDAVYFRSVWGNHQLALDYNVQYRNYHKRYVTDCYNYIINGQNIWENYLERSRFGYTTHNINLKYIYSRPDDIAIQAVFTPHIETRFEKGLSDILSNDNSMLASRSGYSDDRSNIWGPSFDFYLSKKISNEQEITTNVVGTYYGSKQNNLNKEIDSTNTVLMYDRMNLRTHKYSVIGEAAYSKKLGLGSWNAGYRLTYTTSLSTIRNGLSDYLPYNYHSKNQKHYLYGEYSGVYKSLMFRISFGGTYVYSRNDNACYRKFLFTPTLLATTKFSDYHSLQYQLKSEPIVPDISQLSNNSEQVTYHLLHIGNPYLKTGNNITQVLLYNWKNSWLDLSLAALYNNAFSPINMFYDQKIINGTTYLVSTEMNAKTFRQYGGFYTLTLNPVKDVLSFKLYGLCVLQRLCDFVGNNYSNGYYPLYYQISFRKRNWGISYRGSIPSFQIDGSLLVKDENVSHFQAYYQYKKLRFTAGCYWAFTKSKYKSSTLPNEILKRTTSSYINDNRSMFFLGISWNFSKGKEWSIKKKMNNKDSDKGLF